MAAGFDRWEKDPFFAAAEEVQESADRMESAYRTWIHAAKDSSGAWDSDVLTRDLRAALGTTKWQLEEFQRAVSSTYKNSRMDETKDRHSQFIIAMENQVSSVENSLREMTVLENGTQETSWVRLDEGERDELALFLGGPTMPLDGFHSRAIDVDGKMSERQMDDVMLEAGYLSNTCEPSGSCLMEGKDGKSCGHRRTASASPEIGSYKIMVAENGFAQNSGNGEVELMPPPRRVPSFSALVGSLGNIPILKLSKNGFRKLKSADSPREDDSALLRSSQTMKGLAASCESSWSCLHSCDDCDDKQLKGWYGAIRRLLQRSLYQVQYSRSVQVAFWAALLLLSVVLFVLRLV